MSARMVLFLILGMLVLSACQQGEPPVSGSVRRIEELRQAMPDNFEQGKRLLGEKDYEGALAAFKKVAAIDSHYLNVSDLVMEARGAIAAQGAAERVEKARALADEAQIVGDWFGVARNPTIKDQVVLDYIHWDFRSNGTVTRIVEGTISRPREVEDGTYHSPEVRVFIATLDRGRAGTQEFHFKLKDFGLIELIQWRNLTMGHQRYEEGEFFVKDGSREWKRRRKVRLRDLRAY